jgi:hypothetical protein
MKQFWLLVFLFPALLTAATTHHAEYFQQYVKYEITSELNIGLNRLDNKETLLYTNNSPDTLSQVYFHLYLNSYRQHSLSFPDLDFDKGSIRLFNVSENDSINSGYEIDRTLMKLYLHNPLPPGYSVRFKFEFASVIPPASGRYGYQGYHYDIGNWYITPVVYDRAGWHLNQHIQNEFYQEWGDFDVTLRLPRGMVVGATGNLVNSEMMDPDSLDKYRDWFMIYPEDSTLVEWRYQARRVHDFAWTADPSYRLSQAHWDGITLNILAMDFNEKAWSEAADVGIKAIQHFCEEYGRYPYQQLTVADTYIRAGGIEYPQIVFINTYISPDYEPSHFNAVVIHEIAHNWFYGLLGNNQTEEEWLDEGFTTLAEITAMEAIFGQENNYSPGDRGDWANFFMYQNDDRRDNALEYLNDAKFGLDEDIINFHSDYDVSNGYMLAYSKTADVLLMLQYVMGDSLFKAGMLEYFDRWHFRHPYPEDFFATMEDVYGHDLDWFFEQWLNTNRKLDYSVSGVEGKWVTGDGVPRFHARIDFERIEKIFMPIEFDVMLEDSTILRYRIPLDPQMPPVPGRQSLNYWHFSQNSYSAFLEFPAEVSEVIIDPSNRLMDINYLNNRSGWLPKQEWVFMRWQSDAPPIDRYLWEVWPQASYNDVDKLRFGVKLKGGYLDVDHRIDLRLWLKPFRIGSVDFDFTYATPVDYFGKIAAMNFGAWRIDGREGARIGFRSRIQTGSRSSSIGYGGGLVTSHLFDDEYMVTPWALGWVNSMYLYWEYKDKYRSPWLDRFKFSLNYVTSVLSSSADFDRVWMEVSRKFYFRDSDIEFDTRLFAAHVTKEGALFNLSGAGSIPQFGNDFYRSRGGLPHPWRRQGHLYMQGDGNVRGYLLPESDVNVWGKEVVAVNFDLSLPNPVYDFPFIENLTLYLFADAGAAWKVTAPKLNNIPVSAGFSLSWRAMSELGYLFSLNSVRFDFPVYMNRVRSGYEPVELRWLVRFEFGD